jgi:5-methylthioadenosine/S-adenosylhomocysteine deaminase
MKRVLLAGLLLVLPGANAAPPATPKRTPAPAAAPAAPRQKSPCDLVLRAGAVLTVDDSFRILRESSIAIGNGVILEISSPAEIDSKWEPKERLDRRGSVVLPGFVNTHTHAAMNLMRGIADDKPLMEWLTKSIFPAEAKNVSPEFVKLGTSLACLEMVRGGTTTFADMYYFESDVASAVDACGMRAVLGESWIDFPVADHKDTAETIAYTKAFIQKWKGNRRITPAVAPHAPFTNSKETLLAAKKIADEEKVPILIHLSETKDEQKQIQEKYGTTPTKWLDSIGFLGPNVLAAHGVWLDADDMKILAAKKVSLAHNPESNMKLASGIAPVVAARKAGIVVGLGTDGVAGSNNDLDMMEAMDFAGKLAKVSTMDPTVLPARELVRMATMDGARALGLGNVTGSVEVGKAADLIAIEIDEAHTRPIYDITSAIVYSSKSSDVSLTIVDGKVLWDGRKWRTLDPVALMNAGVEWREKISKSIAAPPAVK